MVSAFANLDPAIQENIVKWGLVAAAIGPVLIIGGKFIGLVGSMMSALSGLGGVFATLAGPVGWIALAGTAIAGLAIAWNKTQDALTESTGGFVEATNNLESFEGKVRTTDNLLTRVFGKEIKIEFSAEFEQVKKDVENFYNTLIQDTEAYYKAKWDVDHDGCKDMEEHYKHMEDIEKKHRERVLKQLQDNSNSKAQAQASTENMGKYLMENVGLNSLDAGDTQGTFSTWINKQAEIVQEGTNRINAIYEEGIMTRGKLNKQEEADIARITKEISDARAILYGSVEDQYNAFAAYHIKEGTLYDEKGERAKKHAKDITTSMNKSTESIVKGIEEQIEAARKHEEMTGKDASATIEAHEKKIAAVQDFTREFINRSNENIYMGQELAEATGNSFGSIVQDLYMGRIRAEEYGLTTEQFMILAMDSMINAGASADELAAAILRIPPDKQTKVRTYVEGKVDADELKRAIDRLQDKTVTVTYKQRNVQTYEVVGDKAFYKGGLTAERKATGTDYALPGLTEVAEYGSEIIATRNSAMLATGRQLINLAGGEKIYNARQTKDILDNMGKSSQIDYSDSLRIINSNIILLKEAIERKNFNNVVNNNIEKIDINEVANIEEIEYQLTEMMERRTYGGV